MRSRHYESGIEPFIRFGCGAFLGLVLGLVLLLIIAPQSVFWGGVLVVTPLLISGVLSVKTGDPFWQRLADLWPWH